MTIKRNMKAKLIDVMLRYIKKTDEIASELKFELRVKTKQEVYDIAIEKLYEQITGKKYE
ncbi:hypothetical protein U5R92_00635 [Staphylococcus aureus]